MNLVIQPIDDGVVAVPDGYLVDAGSVLSVGVADGLLSNEINIDDLQLSAKLVDDVGAGVLTLNSDGSFFYDPLYDVG